MLRWAMPLTPKQLVAAAPVMVVNTASLMVISPCSVGTLIIADFLSAEIVTDYMQAQFNTVYYILLFTGVQEKFLRREKTNKYPPAKPGVFLRRAKPYVTSHASCGVGTV